jgi:hypothetical protein
MQTNVQMKTNCPKKRAEWLALLSKALLEMNLNQTVPLLRRDLFGKKALEKFNVIYYEILRTITKVRRNEDIYTLHRDLQLDVFMENESMLMDLFETKSFPVLFELFEYE